MFCESLLFVLVSDLMEVHLFTVVCRQEVVVMAVGLAINGGGKLFI